MTVYRVVSATMKTLLLASLLITCASPAAEISAFRSADELIVCFDDLHLMRLRQQPLKAEINLGSKASFTLDLADPVIQHALAIDVAGFGPLDAISVSMAGATQSVKVDAVTMAESKGTAVAAMERGTKWTGDLPRITLPDASALRLERLAAPARVLAIKDITFPVMAESDLPVLGSQNCVLLVNQRIYFSYRKAVMDEQTLRVKQWRKFLVEVPVNPQWAAKASDEVITLGREEFAVHTTDEPAPNGLPMLGDTSSGLAQGGQSADCDDAGRIYISNVEHGAGLVRFDPAKKKFEQPPVDFMATITKLLPQVPGWRRSWDTALGELLVIRGRVFIVFARHHRVLTPNGNVEVCSGVISLPQDHWDDAEKFRAEVKLHAGCWEGAPNQMYRGEIAPADYSSHKVGGPVETESGLMFAAAPNAKGGPWHFDVDTGKLSEGGTGAAIVTHTGLKKQRLINIGAAGRPLIQFDCGEFRLPRAAVPLLLSGATKDQLVDARGEYRMKLDGVADGVITVRFDVTGLGGGSGVVQGPAFALTAIPGEADQAIGVCEYGYYFSRLDFSKLDSERRVQRTYLPMPGGVAMPAQVRLGPYNTLWASHDDAQWLYVPGYIGMMRLRYATQGRVLDSFSGEMFHERLQGLNIDGAHRDNIKDYKELFPAPGGRMAAIGRGRPGRGGKAFSTGLEVFDPRTLGPSEVATWMTRCFDIWSPVNRVIINPKDGSLLQQIFAGSSTIRADYVRAIDGSTDIPADQHPKVFTYDCDGQGHLRDLFGFALPGPAQLAISRCGQFVMILQDDAVLMTYSIAQHRIVDAARLESRPLEFSRPGATIWSAPDGRVFIMTAMHGISFHEVEVAHDGKIALRPHLSVRDGQASQVERVVRCFMPDLRRNDGSYDFVLGGRHQSDDPAVRVIRDFIPPLERRK